MHTPSALDQFVQAINPKVPWDSIIDFATHPYFCGMPLYPRQKTLLKLMWLETENMTQYDLDVIGEWTKNFGNQNMSVGVQPDIWDRVRYLKDHNYPHFPFMIGVQGRRGSKGLIGAINMAAKAGQLVALDNPQEAFGIAPNKEIFINILATSLTQAQKNLFADTADMIEGAPWFEPFRNERTSMGLNLKTPHDIRRIEEAMARNGGRQLKREIASVRVKPMATKASSGRGQSTIVNAYDEFAFVLSGTGSEVSSEEVFEAAQPALAQFGIHSLTYVPSSPATKIGQFYKLYEQGSVILKGSYNNKSDRSVVRSEDNALWNPGYLVVQLPSYELYQDWERSHLLGGPRFDKAVIVPPSKESDDPVAVSEYRLKVSNPEVWKVERDAQFADVIDGYLDPAKVDRIFDEWQGSELEIKSNGTLKYDYHAHIDPSATNANFAFSIGHLEDAPPNEYGEVWPHVVVDFMKVWKPEDFPDHTIDYIQVERELEDIINRFPGLKTVTADQYQSIGMLQRIKKRFANRTHMRIYEDTYTASANKARYEKFKAIVNLEWLHAPKDSFFQDGEGSLLATELKFLQEKNGKVDRQLTGPCTTKDLSDTVVSITVRMLEGQLTKLTGELMSNTKAKAVNTNSVGLHGRARGIQEKLSAREQLSQGYGSLRPGGLNPSRGIVR